MAIKSFRTIDEQLTILKGRGLTIENEDIAKKFLSYNNYYRVSGYSLTLRHEDVFYPSASMQLLMDIYNFDHELRHLLLKYIEMIEVMMKSIYAYEFAQKYSPLAYRDSALFTDADKHDAIFDKAEKQRLSRLRHEPYLQHFEELGEGVPIWAYVDLLTIADISFLYRISPEELQQAVAQKFALHATKGAMLLGRFMHSMTIIRNLCAHGSRLYNRIFHQKPSLAKKELALLRKDAAGTVDNGHLFGFLLIMRRLLPSEQFASFKQELITLTSQYPAVNLRYCGFREDWKETL